MKLQRRDTIDKTGASIISLENEMEACIEMKKRGYTRVVKALKERLILQNNKLKSLMNEKGEDENK